MGTGGKKVPAQKLIPKKAAAGSGRRAKRSAKSDSEAEARSESDSRWPTKHGRTNVASSSTGRKTRGEPEELEVPEEVLEEVDLEEVSGEEAVSNQDSDEVSKH